MNILILNATPMPMNVKIRFVDGHHSELPKEDFI